MTLSMPVMLVGAGAVVIVGVAIALLAVDSGRKARQTRIDTLLKPYASAPPPEEARIVRTAAMAAPVVHDDGLSKVLALFGVRREQSDLYPGPWWVLLLAMGVVGTMVAALLTAMFGTYAWASQPVFWMLISRSLFGTFAARRARVLYTQMPDALAMIVRSVRTGIPVAEALRIVGREAQPPTAGEFERMYNQLLIGQSLPEALMEMATRTSVPEYRFFAVALALQGQTGGNLTDTLENLGDVIRKRTAMRARAYALSSEARTTMMVLASLPFLAFGALLLMTPHYVTMLFDDAHGRRIFAAAVMSLSMGIGTMQLMIRRALT